MNILNKFSVPFILTELSKDKQNKIYDLFLNQEKYLRDDDPHSKVYTDFFIPKNKNYIEDIVSILREDLYKFYSQVGFRNPIISQAWMQQYTQGCFMTPHNHGTTGYSAIYYIRFNPKEHESTRFISPIHDFITGDNNEYKPVVNQGTLLFFPSFLMHYAVPNSSTELRAILSFNIIED